MAQAGGKDLHQLVEDRGRVKATLTRLKTFFDTCGATAPSDALQAQLNRQMPLLDTFEAIHQQIIAIVKGTSEEEDHEQYRDDFEDTYYQIIGDIQACIQGTQNPALPPSLRNLRMASNSPAIFETPSLLKLPTISLPQFHGSLGEWMTFRDSFEALINRNEALSNIERFLYLKSAVKGEAARALKTLPVSDSNYEAAWEVLCKRYQDTDGLIDYYVGALFSIRMIRKDSADELRELIDDFNNHLRSLKSLEEPVDRWDTLLVHILVEKLDARTREEWERRVSELGRRKTLSDLQTFLEQRYKFLSKTSRPNQLVPFNRSSAQRHYKPSIALHANERKCPSCSANHTLAQCRGFKKLATDRRIDRVEELRVCFNCLLSGHTAKTCTRGACHACKARHHTLLHPASSLGSGTDLTVEKAEDDPNDQYDTSQSLSCMAPHEIPPEHVFLSTAIIQVVDGQGRRHECRALLDQSSQVNILKEEFARRIDLQWEATRAVISGIGATRSKGRVRGRTQIKIASRCSGYQCNLPCLVMPRLTTEIPNFALTSTSLPIPSHLILADPQYHVPCDVDLIIGNGYLWEFMCVEQHRLSAKLPVLLKTQLGWVLAGRIQADYLHQLQ